MDPEHRQQLELRRRALRAESELRARRQSVREQTDILDTHGIPYQLLFDDHAQIEWLWRHFPKSDGLFSPHIDWNRVHTRVLGPAPDAPDSEVGAWQVAGDLALGDCEVVVLSGNGRDPAIRLRFHHLLAHPQVVSCRSDLWVVCEDEGWTVEFLRFEQGWRWGRASVVEGDC